MRFIHALTILASISLVQTARGDDEKEKAEKDAFSVEGVFSIEAPPNGFKWAEVRKVKVNGVNGRIYACTKKGADARLILVVEERQAKDDKTRIATLKGHYNGLAQMVNSAGLEELKGKRPGLAPPIPDRVAFGFSGTNPAGKRIFVDAVTVFGKNVYLLQTLSGSKDEAERLAKVVESLKEPKQDDPEGGSN